MQSTGVRCVLCFTQLFNILLNIVKVGVSCLIIIVITIFILMEQFYHISHNGVDIHENDLSGHLMCGSE